MKKKKNILQIHKPLFKPRYHIMTIFKIISFFLQSAILHPSVSSVRFFHRWCVVYHHQSVVACSIVAEQGVDHKLVLVVTTVVQYCRNTSMMHVRSFSILVHMSWWKKWHWLIRNCWCEYHGANCRYWDGCPMKRCEEGFDFCQIQNV